VSEPVADDVVLTLETLRAEVPEGFTVKGKVFEVEEETQFWNDEYVPMAFNILTEEGEGIGFGFDTGNFPDRPTLAEAILALLEEEHLTREQLSDAEWKALYTVAIAVETKLLARELSYAEASRERIQQFEEELAAIKPDHVSELESRFNGE
jgi:hypothetical protein